MAAFRVRPRGQPVALKRVLKVDGAEGAEIERRFLNELTVQLKLRHKNILRIVAPAFFETDAGPPSPAASYLVTEYCEHGDLLSYFRSRLAQHRSRAEKSTGIDASNASAVLDPRPRRGLSDSEAAYFFSQLVHGIAYLHSLGIIHRDIKLKNLLLDAGMTLKIADFGLATQTTCVPDRLLAFPVRCDMFAFSAHSASDMDRYTVCGTPSTAAPEVQSSVAFLRPFRTAFVICTVTFSL